MRYMTASCTYLISWNMLSFKICGVSLFWCFVKRLCWKYERSETRSANCFVPCYQGNRWQVDFRMTGKTFNTLVIWLTLRLESQQTGLRQSIPVLKRVAIELCRFATGDCFRSIGKLFCLEKSTCVEIARELFKALSDRADKYIRFPETVLGVGEAIQISKTTSLVNFSRHL